MNKFLKIKAGATLPYLAASAVIHLLLFFIAAVIFDAAAVRSFIRSPYVQVSTGMFSKETTAPEEEETKPEETQYPSPEPPKPEQKETSYYYSLNDKNADTTGLKNIYSENTLNVRIKYPSGWTFIDQNVKNKLDGVTFWGLSNIYNPPPYIHLEVKEKYLFNPSRYKYNQELDDYTIYYNDPDEMAGTVTQVIYIRTEDDEDYSLKLIMKGKDSFKTFQPVFFGMLETFSFGKRSIL